MDILFFLTGCLGLAETIDLFCGKDFLIFISDSIDPKKYNLKKVYAVEKWLFAIDTLSLFGMAFHLGGGTGDLVTGLVTAFLAGGLPLCRAALSTARATRLLARHCAPTPATQVGELIARLPEVLQAEREAIFAPLTAE